MTVFTAIPSSKLAQYFGAKRIIGFAAALAVFLVNGAVLLPLGLAAGAFNIIGNWIGSRSFIRQGSSIARPIMLVVVVLFAVRLLFDLMV